MSSLQSRLPVLLMCLVATPSPAWDGVSLGAGSGEADLTVYRAALQWPWQRRWLEAGGWFVGGYWELSLSYWENDVAPSSFPQGRPRGGGEVLIGAVTPVFRWQRAEPYGNGVLPFVEAAVGLSLFSDDRITRTNGGVSAPLDLGGHLQFEDRLGVGLRFGRGQRWELSYRRLHYSNGGIWERNDGVNLNLLTLGCWF